MLSFLYSPTLTSIHDYWKNYSLDRRAFVGKGTRGQIANIPWIIEKAREFQKNNYFCFIDYAKAFDCVDHNKLENSERDGNTRPPDLPLLRLGSWNSSWWWLNYRLLVSFEAIILSWSCFYLVLIFFWLDAGIMPPPNTNITALTMMKEGLEGSQGALAGTCWMWAFLWVRTQVPPPEPHTRLTDNS